MTRYSFNRYHMDRCRSIRPNECEKLLFWHAEQTSDQQPVWNSTHQDAVPAVASEGRCPQLFIFIPDLNRSLRPNE